VLHRLLFSRALWPNPAVQTFDCGAAPWEIEVGKWIAAEEGAQFDSALYCAEQGKCSVWLYAVTTDPLELVGFASLGRTNWKLPERTPVQIVPHFAIAKQYQGQPPGAKPADRYASLAFTDVIREAASRWKNAGAPKVLALYVHPNNVRAIRFYLAHAFVALPDLMSNGYTGMLRELTDADLPPAPDAN
jgi:ribosomal protein S18 acetylase RimI-like enzyme